MEHVFQICVLAVTAAVFCVLLRNLHGVHGVLLSLGASAVILLLSLRFLRPILELLEQLRVLSTIDDEVTRPMMKVVGIGIVAQLAADLCRDAEEKALGKAVELSAAVLSVYTALPLLSSVLDMLQRALRLGT